jgi:hypothetical protein
MARADEPRVYVRLSRREYEDIARAADVAGVAVGALVRVCAVNWCAYVAAELKASGRDFGRMRSAGGVRAVTPQGPGGRS